MWFTETAWPPTILMILAVAACLYFGLRRGNKKWLIAGIVLALAIPVVFVVERSIITPGEEIEALIGELRDAVVAQDVDATLAFLSPRAIKEQVLIRTGMSLGHIKPDVDITDLDVNVTANTTAASHFRANGTFVLDAPLISGEKHVATRWRLLWRREAGEWKIYGIERLDPITGEVISILEAG